MRASACARLRTFTRSCHDASVVVRSLASWTGFAALMLGASFVFPSGAASVAGIASPFTGEWRIDYPCDQATGLYAERCAAGDRDFLQFELSVQGDRLCGTDVATAQLGNHADDGGEIVGTWHGNVAHVSWVILGAHGVGTMTVHDGMLVFQRGPWKADDGAQWSFPPAETTMLKRIGEPDPTLASCPSFGRRNAG